MLQRYICAEYLFSFFVAFLFFVSIFFVNQILVLARNQLAEMVSLLDTLRLILYALPAIIALAVPYASFIGVILAIGKLSEGCEILAARANGFGIFTLLIPVLLTALGLSSISFMVNDYLLPVSTMNYSRFYQELLYSNPRLVIEPYAIRKYDNSILITGNVDDLSIDGLMILDKTNDGTDRTINARQAELQRNDRQQGIITLKLENVEMFSMTNSIIQESSADSMEYNILLEDIALSVGNPSVREMSARDVHGLIQEQEIVAETQFKTDLMQYVNAASAFYINYFAHIAMENSNDHSQILDYHKNLPELPRESGYNRTLRLYRMEFWKKFSIPFASLTFILIGFPLGLTALKVGRNVGIFTGFLLGGIYWGLLLLNEFIGIRLIEVPTFFIAFSPNFAMIIVGILLIRLYFKH